jgi:outer membrane protein OmpA-like peptidoglycan-associated protein
MHQALLPLAAILILTASPLLAQSVDISGPGGRIQVHEGGTAIQAPGVTIQVPNSVDTGLGDDLNNTVVIDQPVYVPAPARPARASGNSYVNAELPGMDFSGQNLAGAQFTNADLQGASFRNTNLAGADFTNADLTHADFSGANLTDADLTNATLSGAILVGTVMTNVTLTNADMSGVIRQALVAAPIVTATAIRQRLQAPVKPGERAKIDLTVNFDFNSDRLTADGAKQVAEIAAALQDTSMASMPILIEGHTDNIGSDAYNQKLSERRANRVLQTLTGQYYVSQGRLSAQGFGESRPLASNDNDLGRAKNRRVTLVNIGTR